MKQQSQPSQPRRKMFTGKGMDAPHRRLGSLSELGRERIMGSREGRMPQVRNPKSLVPTPQLAYEHGTHQHHRLASTHAVVSPMQAIRRIL
jgi:hypothetical protein